MTQVVDASLVVAMLLDAGPVGRWCEQEMLRDDLAAPALMPYEAANVIHRTLLRGAIDQTAAAHAIDDLERLDVDLVAFEATSVRAWELRANLTAYDASYVALAETLGARLLTLDERVANAPGASCTIEVAPEA